MPIKRRRDLTFPSEIIFMFARILAQNGKKATLSSLSLCSQTTYKDLTPILYQDVIIPHRTSLDGLMNNLIHFDDPYPHPDDNYGKPQGKERTTRLLNIIQELTLESIPLMTKIPHQGVGVLQRSQTSTWHILRILFNHHHNLQFRLGNRLRKMTITGTAIEQLKLPEPIPQVRFDPITRTSVEITQVSMPPDDSPPPVDSQEFQFFTQSGFPLSTLMTFFQPLHLIVKYPSTWWQPPKPTGNRGIILPLSQTRPHEFILRSALESLPGLGTTICLHGLHDQSPPVGHVGADHHISFIASPSVPALYERGRDTYPYISIFDRVNQVKDIIRRSNPRIPDLESCITDPARSLTSEDWERSKKGRWTFYRVGAMISSDVREEEWVHGERMEIRMKAWVRFEYSQVKGHPKGFADSINERLTFVHGDEDSSPDDVKCEACGHTCGVGAS
jgi:hypothetical protein